MVPIPSVGMRAPLASTDCMTFVLPCLDMSGDAAVSWVSLFLSTPLRRLGAARRRLGRRRLARFLRRQARDRVEAALDPFAQRRVGCVAFRLDAGKAGHGPRAHLDPL